ncbi:hypothetical protein SAMN05518863_101670 [Candidatus Pantoea symbiotica]|uniref:Uncharacterized protein n=1 Tax=Candidatus Pantoea symbiotica TaxID=1884370 RepID=A0A1I3RRG6_9GAMM|nr:hypothetical protein SAMN05518863_101670 [Pantoea symbiotica]SFU41051.1 hypothetical protein SAMN05518864_101670 [Pantoea sp. YR525]
MEEMCAEGEKLAINGDPTGELCRPQFFDGREIL